MENRYVRNARKVLCIGVLLLTVLISCKKGNDDIVVDREALIEKSFFELPKSSKSAIVDIVNQIKRDNNNRHFVADFVRKNGRPVWDKVFYDVQNEAGSRSTVNAGGGTYVIIPCLAEGNNEVAAYITCYQQTDSFHFGLVNKSATIAALNADFADSNLRKYQMSKLHTFAYFEKQILHKDSLVLQNCMVSKIFNADISTIFIAGAGRDGSLNAGNSGEELYNTTYAASYISHGYDPTFYNNVSGGVWILTTNYQVVGGGSSPLISSLNSPNGEPDIIPSGGGSGFFLSAEDFEIANSTFVAPSGSAPLTDLVTYFKCFDNTPGSIYDIIVCVDQPTPGSREPYTDGGSGGGSSSNSSKGGRIDVGHSFFTLKQTKPNGSVVIRSIGFYPKTNGVSPLNTSDSGVVVNDRWHPFDVSLTTSVSGNEFRAFLNVLINRNVLEKYNLNTYNCTTFCIRQLQAIGINLPESQGSWFLGSGANPGALGEDIRIMVLQANQTRNTTGGDAPSNDGIC